MRFYSVILIVILLSSCSVKKRIYRDGYAVDWAWSKKKAVKESGKAEASDAPFAKASKFNDLPLKSNLASTAKVKELSDADFDGKKGLILLQDTCGDQIFFKSGDIIVAKVLEITEDKIKYKRCDNLEGPQFVVLKSSVQVIKYSNGVTENIEPSVSNPNSEISQGPRPNVPLKVHPKAIGSIIACALGFVPFLFFIPFIISLVMSKNAIKEIEANPKIYKGTLLAEVAHGISLFMLILIGVVLAIFLIALLLLLGTI